ncbi:MAG: hypothetical protein K6E79_02560 [Pseudobutyrivibrio sp.]|nr:hypothetical protein [Pseudobutyrivibrio sp.]
MKRALRIIVAVVCMVTLVVGYYAYLSHKQDLVKAEDKVELSEVQAILTKNFATDYPVTPRSVVKWYNRIITAYYAEDFTDEELSKMADQARCLLDDELLNYNPRDQYVLSLSSEIEDYHNRQRIIVSSSVSASKEVRYEEINGYECAFVSAYYFIREGSTYTRTYEDFCLRKDDNGNWKILTWQLSPKDDTDEF